MEAFQDKDRLSERRSLSATVVVCGCEALTICAARVAADGGDARKALQVCRRAIEVGWRKIMKENEKHKKKKDESKQK